MVNAKEKLGGENRGSVMCPTDLAVSPDSHFQPDPSLSTPINLELYYHPINKAVVGISETAVNAVSNDYFAILLAAKFANNMSAEFLDGSYG